MNLRGAGPCWSAVFCLGVRRLLEGVAVIALLVALMTGGWPATVSAGEWKGEQTTLEGVLHVSNPAEPIEEAKSAKLKELWRLGGDTDDEDEFFGVISQILGADDGSVFILDTQLAQIKVYSADGDYLRTIGREGEGPGEFRFPVGMFFDGDGNVGVMQVQPGKIVLLTPEGEPAGEHPVPKSPDGSFLQLVGGQAGAGNLVLAAAVNAFSEGKFEQTRYLASVGPNGDETARYCQDKRNIETANAVLDDMEWDTFDRRWVVAQDGRVFAVTQYPDYRIEVWNPDGTVNRVIEREYTHRKRTAEEKEIITNLMNIFARQIPNCTVRITDNTKDIESIFVRDDGSMWVLSSAGSRDNPDGSIGVFDVFDAEGRFVRQVTLEGEGDPVTDGYYFVKNRLYVVTDLLQAAISLQAGGESFQVGDEEPEPMSVICYELQGEFLTSSR
ncbi:MAG: 6-bladed beta-propeller [Candidatus Krumholzibacteria bacterium]|nr:6-bladed beta-propeller [Candidatus Krumholzibacteria bacterium]